MIAVPRVLCLLARLKNSSIGFIEKSDALLSYVSQRAIRLYRWVFNPITGQCCRFYPSCSHYAEQSLQIHGFLKSIPKISWRILRCNPFNPGGVDYPARKQKGEAIHG